MGAGGIYCRTLRCQWALDGGTLAGPKSLVYTKTKKNPLGLNQSTLTLFLEQQQAIDKQTFKLGLGLVSLPSSLPELAHSTKRQTPGSSTRASSLWMGTIIGDDGSEHTFRETVME